MHANQAAHLSSALGVTLTTEDAEKFHGQLLNAFNTGYGRALADAGHEIARLQAENEALKMTQYGSGRMQALRDQRDALLAVAKELQESAAYWSEYDVPLGIVDRLNAAIAKVTP